MENIFVADERVEKASNVTAMKHIFIVNEMAGKGQCKKLLPKIEEACKNKNYEYEIKYISEEMDAAKITSQYKNEENVIYVVGGDGTLTRALSGFVGTKNKLGIIPAGSGNDTYRAISKLPDKETQIDLGKINDMYFINVACTGIDAEVGNNLDLFRNSIIPAKYLYYASILYTFKNYKFKNIKFKTSTKTFESYYSIVSICNGKYYGGGFNIAPKSELTDGLLDIYFADKMSKLKIIPLILKLKKGKHEGKRKIHKFRENHIELELEEEITFNVDGEKLTDKKFVIDIIPKAITVYNDKEFVDLIIN